MRKYCGREFFIILVYGGEEVRVFFFFVIKCSPSPFEVMYFCGWYATGVRNLARSFITSRHPP